MFRTALCFHLGVRPRDRVVLGDRGAEFPEGPVLDAEVIAGPRPGAEFPESPALGTEVIAGPQPGALGFRADAPDVSGGGGRPVQAMESFHGGCPACV